MVLDKRLGGQGHPWCIGWPYLTPRKIPWMFRGDIFIGSVSRMGGPFIGVLGGCWGFLTGNLKERVILDVMDELVQPQGRYPESFMLISLLEVCQEWGVLHGGTWRTLRVPERRLGGHGHPWCHGWSCLTLRTILWKFHVVIFIRSVSRLGGPSLGYLEDVEGSWWETWRTGSS